MNAKNKKGILELSWEDLRLVAGGDCDVSPEDPCGEGDYSNDLNLNAQGSYATSYDESGGP